MVRILLCIHVGVIYTQEKLPPYSPWCIHVTTIYIQNALPGTRHCALRTVRLTNGVRYSVIETSAPFSESGDKIK